MKKALHLSVFLSLILLTISMFGQTNVIFHKSHSGKAADFSIGSEDGFGLPSKRIMIIEKLSDSVVVFHHDMVFWGNDTVLHAPILKKKPRAIRKLYGEQVELVGFEKEKEEKDDGFATPPGLVDPLLPLVVLLACFVIALSYAASKPDAPKSALA
jgi:hypothetical protein